MGRKLVCSFQDEVQDKSNFEEWMMQFGMNLATNPEFHANLFPTPVEEEEATRP